MTPSIDMMMLMVIIKRILIINIIKDKAEIFQNPCWMEVIATDVMEDPP